MAQAIIAAQQAWLSGCSLRVTATSGYPCERESVRGCNTADSSSRSPWAGSSLSHTVPVNSPQATAAEPSFSGGNRPQVHRRRRRQGYASQSSSGTSLHAVGGALVLPEMRRRGGSSSAALEAWLQESVLEIIKHLREAPFLHLVFDRKADAKCAVRWPVAEELFGNADTWTSVRDVVLKNEPDGVILVHRLNEGDAAKCYGAEYTGISSSADDVGDDAPSKTAVWGLVIQSRGNKRHGCYILKTTKVFSMAGACTKFSLTKAKCFGPALHKQLESSWLV